MPSRPLESPAECANCGEPIPRGAKSCSACGADERTGWRESDIYDGLDLPDDAWADVDAPSSPDPRPLASGRPGQLAWYWWATGLLLFLAFGMAVLGLR
ncbi:zinc ribbon domain-containing protein [Synoicihabitans lomoniglobus]|uniref:Zinc ribbon domain-containing protein n=1 Tax=Synoicihabitans lomoniglobus TaxID=2909285 RepID=A0AAF0I3A8_9BACT|nr:zinc ribbon domain-containing protein [Opitutaceae bacterium LMO-M01]WED67017.1 zinc ribbon domain-containing protein [Opitutaceae bacterium LMO-M01]